MNTICKKSIVWRLPVLALVCFSVFGEVSEDRLRDLKRRINIGAIRDLEEGGRDNEKLVLRVEFSSRDKELDGILVRVAVEITDKQLKKVYLAEGINGFRELPDSYEGEGHWDFTMPYGDLERLKITAYSVEFGVRDGDEFVPFSEKYEHLDSYDELKQRALEGFPNRCQLTYTILVSD